MLAAEKTPVAALSATPDVAQTTKPLLLVDSTHLALAKLNPFVPCPEPYLL
jgi:hypothetical protein